MNTFFLMLLGFMLGSMTGSIFVILYFREEILNKEKIKILKIKLENAKVCIQEYLELSTEYLEFKNRLEPIETYLQEKHGLTFVKIEKLILEENYKKNNIININNFRKFK